MDHHDHVNLLRMGIEKPGGTWADFGSGSGAFTLALRDLVGPNAELYSIDQDGARLREQEQEFQRMLPRANVNYVRADFSKNLTLPPLDGIVMANALHYFRDKTRLLQHVRSFLKPQGIFILVEYDVDAGNMWVPHPLSFQTYQKLAPKAGFSEPVLLATAPSRFLRGFYAAAARNQ